MAFLCIRKPMTFLKGIRYFFKYGPRGFFDNFKNRASYEIQPYKIEEIPKESCTGDILFSVLMPVYNVEIKWLEAAIASVKAQNYRNWELCIVDDCSTDLKVRSYLETLEDQRIKIQLQEKNGGISTATNAAAKLAKGEYLILLDNDDEIAPRALYEFYQRIKATDADIIYSDQDIIDQDENHTEPFHKPDWSYDLLLSQMYIGHLLGIRKTVFEKAGGFRSEFNGSQDYDLMLRLAEHTTKIEHIAKILYHWRALPSSTASNPDSKPYAQTAGLMAIQNHLDRVYGKETAKVEETDAFFVYDVRFSMKEKPLVSIIMPTKDHADYLKNVIDSVEQKTTYPNYEILILNNNSQEKETKQYFEEVQQTYDNVRVIDALFEFNWSKLNNFGIRHAKGDIFIFMNNDMDVITPDWMERLAEQAMRKEIGVAGGLLLYEDGTIQHAGVVAGMGGWADHVFKGMKPVHYGSPFLSPMVKRNVTAVTGACMAISREKIEAIGNFDEHFIVCGSDIEICIRAINRGYVNIYDPYVQLHHFESKTRDSKIPEIDFKLSYKMYEKYHSHTDPYYNICLDMNSCVPKRKERN